MGRALKKHFRWALLLALPVFTAGCIGIAHKRVPTASLEVQLINANDAKVELWHVPMYWQSTVLTVLGGGVGSLEGNRRALLSQPEPHVIFPAEDRYIGYPSLFPIAPLLAPGEEAGVVQTLMLRCAGSDKLVRIVAGSNGVATTEVSVAELRGRLPELLKRPMPAPRDPSWESYHEQLGTFARDVAWQGSDRVTGQFIPSKAGGRSMLKIESKCEEQ